MTIPTAVPKVVGVANFVTQDICKAMIDCRKSVPCYREVRGGRLTPEQKP
jgi:hypothetical protein